MYREYLEAVQPGEALKQEEADFYIAQIELRFHTKLPEDYKGFMRQYNGGTGTIGEEYVKFYSLRDVMENNEACEVDMFTPGILLIGDNGGGEAFALDFRGIQVKYVVIPFVLEYESIIEQGPTLENLLERISRSQLFDKPFLEDGSVNFSKLVQWTKTNERKGAFIALAKCYFGLGRAYFWKGDEKEKEKAMLYLERCQGLCSKLERVCTEIPEEIQDNCDSMILQLEDAGVFSCEVADMLESRGRQLKELMKLLWTVLALARLCPLFQRAAELPGCEMMGQIEEILDILFKAVYEEPSPQEINVLHKFTGAFYAFGDSENYLSTKKRIAVQGGAEMQMLDLNGMNLATELVLLVDKYLEYLEYCKGEMEAKDTVETAAIGCTLLKDYFVRTDSRDLYTIPQICQEMERIDADLQFVKTNPGRQEAEERYRAYKKLDLLEDKKESIS